MTFQLPAEYGYVVLSILGSGLSLFFIAGPVMKERKRCEVPYPNMYASIVVVNGKEYTNAKDIESAHRFNQTQRGHQNALETYPWVSAMTIIGGLDHPRIAAAGCVAYIIGCNFYAKQYASGGPNARNKGLAAMKYLGLVTLLGLNCMVAYNNLTAK